MSKEFELKTNEREARPRSKRLRELHSGSGSGGSTVVNVTGGSSAPVEGHTHPNKYNLDQITTDGDGYLSLTQQKEVIDPEAAETRIASVTEKVKAGWADKAGTAHDLDEDSPVREQFLSKIADDVAKGHITFEKGLTALITSYFKGGSHFGEFVKGLAGAIIDSAGNAEFESITARGYLKVFELIYNRLNAVEGNTSFADVGTIESIEEGPDGSQVLTMRKRWDGDFTAFQPGDVVYSYINNLNNGAAIEYFKAWAWVKSVDRAANTLTVVPYADNMVPAGVNHALAPSQIITRWGNNIEATAITWANPDYSAVISKRGENDYVNVRQSTFYISCEDGNIVELMGVNKPILEAGNYGTVLGKMPAGLLDPATQELVNKDHPYLFARGIIVQDLIRMDYTGTITRTGNYRGTWSAATAASPTDYYRSLPGTYDTVTWKGDLWQCVATGNTDEPSESSGNWVNMTGSQQLPTLDVWQILPNTDIVTLRYEGNKVTIIPEKVTCQILLTSTEGTETFNNNYDLTQKGVHLYYSLNGATWKEFVIGVTEPLDLEDETDIIETEGTNPEALTLGGDDVSTDVIGDRIYFELRSATDVLARTTVPIVKDGEKGDKGDKGEDGKDGVNGLPGRDGLMVYPAGAFDANTTYTATGETAPVVMYSGNFYVLKRGLTYSATSMPDNRKTPAGDVAYGGADTRWQVFDKFNAIFADIVMADFAKLSSAVFYGDWLISQQGIRNGAASTEYQYFKDGSFTPNFSVNFNTGEMHCVNGIFSGAIRTSLKTLEESDAIDVGPATINMYAGRRYRIHKDLDLNVSNYSELELPTDPSYIGARITICESAGAYSRNLDFVTIKAQNGGIIGGIAAEDADELDYNKSATEVRFLNGVVQFLGVQQWTGTTSQPTQTKWMIISANAGVIYGRK